MKKKSFLALIVLLLLSGCGTVQRALYHKPVLEDPTVAQKNWGDGVVFDDSGMCMAISEGSQSTAKYPVAVGPLGIPLIPTGAEVRPEYEKRSSIFVELWFMPDRTGYSFDPHQVEIRLSDGTYLKPESMQKSWYGFLYEKMTFGLEEKETISTPKHDQPVLLKNVHENIDLPFKSVSEPYDRYQQLVQISLKFRRNSPSTTFDAVILKGMIKDGRETTPLLFKLVEKDEKRVWLPGMDGSNNSFTIFPHSICNSLKKK